jgi:hypothetical protein
MSHQITEPETAEELQAKASGLLKPFDVEALAERLKVIHKAKERCMTKNVHYGPAFDKNQKDTLLKPGAEVLCQIFGLGQHLKVTERLLEGGHILYTVRATVFDLEGGLRVVRGFGNGCCTTMEYKYRKQTQPKWGDDGKQYPSYYTPFDFYNLCLKIAEKRAFVDGAIRSTGASAVFTQDIEEDPKKFKDLNGEQDAAPSRAPAPRPNQFRAQAPQRSREEVTPLAKETLPGVGNQLNGVLNTYRWENKQDKVYHYGDLDGGKYVVGTTDEGLAKTLKDCVGQPVSLEVAPIPGKSGKYRLLGFLGHGVGEGSKAAAQAANEEQPENEGGQADPTVPAAPDAPVDPDRKKLQDGVEALMKASGLTSSEVLEGAGLVGLNDENRSPLRAFSNHQLAQLILPNNWRNLVQSLRESQVAQQQQQAVGK